MKRTGNSSQAVLVPLGVFSLKRSTVGAFAVPVRVLSQKKYDRRYTVMVVLELVPQRGETHFKPRPQSRILVSLRGSFKISNEHPRPFHMGSPRTDCRTTY